MSVTVHDEAALRLLGQLEDAQLLPAALEAGATWMYTELIHYPPERSHQSYERTQDLLESWDVTGGGLQWRVASEGVDYAVLVQDEDEQAWMHEGRWKTYQKVAEEGESRIETDLLKRVKAAVT